MEKFGIDTLKPAATAMGQMGDLGYGFLVKKSGLLPVLFGINAPMNAFGHFFTKPALAQAILEVKDLSAEEGKQLDAAVLAPMRPELQAVLAPVDNLFQKVLMFVEKNLEVGKEDFADVQSIVADAKALFGVAA